jgi:hypothetical protein
LGVQAEREQFCRAAHGGSVFVGDGSSYVHLGIGVRYVGEDEGSLRFRGRPESNVTDYFVDSGSIAGDHETR